MKVLFFTQNLARTGSEIALYNIIRHANRTEFEMAVAAGGEGELLKELPADVPYSIYADNESPSLLSRAKRRARRLVSREPEEWLAEYARNYEGYIWYVNSIVQPWVVRQARRFGVDCAVQSNEMEHMFWHLQDQDARDLIEYPRLVLANSESARKVLWQLGRKERLEVNFTSVDLSRVVASQKRARAIRAELGIREGTFVWAMAGSVDSNKNPVLFTELAHELSQRGHQVHFLWLVGGEERGYQRYVEGVAESLNLAGKVTFVRPPTGDYYEYLNSSDGLVVTSTRESFSMVTVEAAYLGKIVVAFNCGGVKEIVRDGMGAVVDLWNRADLIAAMEAAMTGRLAFDPNVARARLAEFDAPVQARRWEQLMRDHFSPPVSG